MEVFQDKQSKQSGLHVYSTFIQHKKPDDLIEFE